MSFMSNFKPIKCDFCKNNAVGWGLRYPVVCFVCEECA
jgi:hypothetical protein